MRTHDFAKPLTGSGEIRTPIDLGTPVCVGFAPPWNLRRTDEAPRSHTTHCLAGFASDRLGIYKKRDWTGQLMLQGHDEGVASLAVHPTGSMALSGGLTDGKLKLWDTWRIITKFHRAKPPRWKDLVRFNPLHCLDRRGVCVLSWHTLDC